MALTIDLPTNLEKMLRDKAQRLGLALDVYLVDVLRRGSYEPHPLCNRGTREEPWIRGYMSRTSFELEGSGTDFRIFPSLVAACDGSSEARKSGFMEVKIEPLRQFSIYEPIEDKHQHFALEKQEILFYEEVKTKILALFEELRPLMVVHDHYEIRVPNAEAAIAFWFDYHGRLHSPLGLERAFSMAISFILAHPQPVRIHQQALDVACDLGMVRQRRWHLTWIELADAFHKEFPSETFDMRRFDQWCFSNNIKWVT